MFLTELSKCFFFMMKLFMNIFFQFLKDIYDEVTAEIFYIYFCY